MTTLAQFQRRFAAAVRSHKDAVSDCGIIGAGLAPAQRLGIYRNHHRISLGEALSRNFTATAATIGEDAFDILRRDFIARFPPMTPCLVDYGAGFPDFLARDARLTALPYLQDIARLDWALNRAQQAADAEIFTAQHLAALQETDLSALIVTPHPSLSLIRSPFPLLRIWQLAQRENDAGGPDAGETDEATGISLDDGGCNLLIWRRDGDVTRGEIDDEAADVMAALIAGKSLGEASLRLAPERLPQFIAGCVLAGTFLPPSPTDGAQEGVDLAS